MNKRNFSLVKYLLISVLLINAISLDCQIVSTATFKVDSVQIGDPFKVEIKVSLSKDIDLDALDFSVYKNIENIVFQQDTIHLEKVADIEVLDFGTWKHEDWNNPIDASKLQISDVGGNMVIKNTITIAIYNAGVFGIPGPSVMVTDGQNEVLPTASKTVQVFLPLRLTQQDSVDINPIKDIMYEKADITDYLVYIYILVALLLMMLVGYYFYKRKNAKPSIELQEVIILIQPDQKALQALEHLKEENLWQNGQIKAYQTRLTDIIRTYLEERYGINAPEMTTDEIAIALKNVDFDMKYTIELKEILQVADLVKFAKATPDVDIHSLFMDKAVDFVINTRQSSSDVKKEESI